VRNDIGFLGKAGLRSLFFKSEIERGSRNTPDQIVERNLIIEGIRGSSNTSRGSPGLPSPTETAMTCMGARSDI
jgi:hypothetical protein